jgi:hypothetical protein
MSDRGYNGSGAVLFVYASSLLLTVVSVHVYDQIRKFPYERETQRSHFLEDLEKQNNLLTTRASKQS